jgi:mannose/fructose/N-acetylgalactosamine-specific phosphotransferase system component IIB
MLRSTLDTKANINEIDGLRRILDRVLKEIEFKCSFKDLEGHINYTKNALEEVNKELLLRASIKDLCTLLDQKANIEDVNSTLSLVQREVERFVPEEEMRKALND